MNFVIRQTDGIITSRLDTTINRQNIDFYVPDGVKQLFWAPALFIRLHKSGKAIGEQFASRYAEALSFGALLYPDGSQVCDCSTLLPMPLYNMQTLLSGGNEFSVRLDGEQIFALSTEKVADKVNTIIADCSLNTAIRLGDYAAAQLQAPAILLAPGKSEGHLETLYCGNLTSEIKIKF